MRSPSTMIHSIWNNNGWLIVDYMSSIAEQTSIKGISTTTGLLSTGRVALDFVCSLLKLCPQTIL